VLLTAGGKQALFNAALALFEEGDEVITHAPYWPTIPEQVKLVGAKPVIVSTRPDDGFAVHAEKMIAAITPRTKGIIINSPCNPTARTVDEATTSAIATRPRSRASGSSSISATSS
jgi:aspartate aminotransferase